MNFQIFKLNLKNVWKVGKYAKRNISYPFIQRKIVTERLNLMSLLYISHVMDDLMKFRVFCTPPFSD